MGCLFMILYVQFYVLAWDDVSMMFMSHKFCHILIRDTKIIKKILCSFDPFKQIFFWLFCLFLSFVIPSSQSQYVNFSTIILLFLPNHVAFYWGLKAFNLHHAGWRHRPRPIKDQFRFLIGKIIYIWRQIIWNHGRLFFQVCFWVCCL